MPTSDQLNTDTKSLNGEPDERPVSEDLLWMLLNSNEFVVNY